MIKIKPDILFVKDPTTGAFVPLLAIKGSKGDVGNISDYITNETGDSELFAMSQKGATAIKDELTNDIADTKTELEDNISNTKSELEDNISNTKSELEGDIADTKAALEKKINNINVGSGSGSGEDISNIKTELESDIADAKAELESDIAKITSGETIVGKATTAVNVQGVEGTNSVARHVWFSEATNPDQRAYNDNFKYDPHTDTLTVGNINGNVEVVTATKALQDGNGNNIADTYAPLSKLMYTKVYEIEGDGIDYGLKMGNTYNLGSMPTGKTISDVVAVAIQEEEDGHSLFAIVAQEDGITDGNRITVNCGGTSLNSLGDIEMASMQVSLYVTNTTNRYLMFTPNKYGSAYIDSEGAGQNVSFNSGDILGSTFTIKVYVK